MVNKLSNIYVAEPLVTGVCFVAPRGTTGPTDAQIDLDPLFTDLGYMGVDGFLEKSDRSITRKRSFGGKVVKIIQSEFTSTLEFTFMESINADVLKAIYGASNVIITPATTEHGTQVKVLKNSRKLPHQSWVLDTWDDEMGAKYRNYVADGQITTTGDVKVVHTDTIEYKVTLDCFETEVGLDNIVTYTDDNVILGS